MWRENKSWQVAFSKQDVHQNILSPHNSFKIKAFWNLDTGRSGAEWAEFVIITHKLCSANKKATGGGGGVCVGERGWGWNRCIMSARLKKNKCSPSLVCVSLILCPFAFSLPPPLPRSHSYHLKCVSSGDRAVPVGRYTVSVFARLRTTWKEKKL